MNDMNEWIIGIGGSENDGVDFIYVLGNENEVKEYLFKLIKEEREKEIKEWDDDYYDFGTETVEELQIRPNGSIYGFNCFSDKHTDYEATKTDMIKTINL